MPEHERKIALRIINADALRIEADVLALKFPKSLHGLERVVYDTLTAEIGSAPPLPPDVGDSVLLGAPRSFEVGRLLFVGVESLPDFGYEGIRRFSKDVLAALAQRAPGTKHLLLTFQGAGCGLDDGESFDAEIAGLLDGIAAGDFPPSLVRVTIVERDRAKWMRIKALREEILPGRSLLPGGPKQTPAETEKVVERLEAAGSPRFPKEHIFVAMPLHDSTMDATFHYSIRPPIRAAGYLCERAEHTVFTGHIMEWVRERIASASLVIADVTVANPNVYLEIGLAWGYRRPTLIVTGDETTLLFDLQGQRYVKYDEMMDLEKRLNTEITALKAQGVLSKGGSS